MSDIKRKALIEKQIEVYDYIVKGMAICAEVVRNWHGKIYDKRFDTDLHNALAESGVRGYADTACPNFYVNFHADNDYVSNGPMAGVSYVRTRDQSFNFSPDKAFDFTAAGKRRINADKIIPMIEQRIADTILSRTGMQYLLDNLESFHNEAQSAAQAVQTFRMKWSWEQQAYGGASFSLRNESSMRDYSISC